MSEELEIIEAQPIVHITQQDVNATTDRLRMLKNFIASQLVENEDFGIIPGVRKKSLFQPGAQKLARLLNLSCKKECTHRFVDFEQNVIVYSYKASVFKGEQLISECEASCTTAEAKYSRVSKEKGVGDLLNTIQKMAQKRAFVGAIIEAVAGSMEFTQDIESAEDARDIGIPNRAVAKANVPNVTHYQAQSQSNKKCSNCSSTLMVDKFEDKKLYCNPKTGGCGMKVGG